MESTELDNAREPLDSGVSLDNDSKMDADSHSDSGDEDSVFRDATEPLMKTEGENPGVNPEYQKASAVMAVKESLLFTANQVKFGLKYFLLTFVVWTLGYFNFSFLWLVMGVILYTWREQRRKRKKLTSEVLKSIGKDERKYFQTVKDIYKMSGRELPSWVYFPDVEKAEWLNRILEQLWPYVGDYVKKIIIEQVQPSIQQSNKLLKGFSFSTVDLGERSPRVSGIKVYGDNQTRRSEIVMDMQIIYDSSCEYRITINKLNAGIRNLSVRGVLRVELRPLIDTIPFAGAVSVAFVHQPNIDFDLTDLGNLFDLPLIDSALRTSISEVVSRMLVLPEKYVVPLCDNIMIKTLLHPLPKGVVRVHIIEAKNLEEKDKKILGIGGGSDPFVELKVGVEAEFKTKVIRHEVNPKWNESFDAIVSDFHTSTIEITLYDDDGAINKADYLGTASIQMKTVYNQGVVDEWISLSNVKHGRIHVRVEWLDLSSDPKDLKKAMEAAGKHNLNAALLDIYVDSARELPGFNEGRYEPNPQVKILMPGHTKPFKSQIIQHSNNPKWEENFRGLIQNPRMESIDFTVEDNADSLGNLRVRVNKLIRSPNMTLEEPFLLSNSGPNSELLLHLTVRLLKPKGQSQGHSKNSFIIAESNKPDVDLISRSKSKGSSSRNHSPPEIEEPVMPTEEPPKEPNTPDLGINFAGSGPLNGSPRLRNISSSSLHRNPSISSEASNTFEVNNLKERLNKRIDNNNSDSAKNPLGRISLTLSFSAEKEKLYLDVHKAENLIVCDEDNNTSDPYVRVYVMPDKKSSSRRTTKVVKNNLNPVFNERLEYSFLRDELKDHQLSIAVKNKTGLLSSEKVLMGKVIIDLALINFDNPSSVWYPLEVKDKDD